MGYQIFHLVKEESSESPQLIIFSNPPRAPPTFWNPQANLLTLKKYSALHQFSDLRFWPWWKLLSFKSTSISNGLTILESFSCTIKPLSSYAAIGGTSHAVVALAIWPQNCSAPASQLTQAHCHHYLDQLELPANLFQLSFKTPCITKYDFACLHQTSKFSRPKQFLKDKLLVIFLIIRESKKQITFYFLIISKKQNSNSIYKMFNFSTNFKNKNFYVHCAS